MTLYSLMYSGTGKEWKGGGENANGSIENQGQVSAVHINC